MLHRKSKGLRVASLQETMKSVPTTVGTTMLNSRTWHAERDVSYKPEQYRKTRHSQFGTLPPDKISIVNQEDLRHL